MNLEKKWQFRMKAPGFQTVRNGKTANMLEHKVWELSTYMKNKKMLRVRSSTTFAQKRRANA